MSKIELLLLILAILGGLDLAGRGLEFLASLFPRFLSVRAKIWCVLSDTFTIPATRKRAIAAGIESVVNNTVFRFQRHMPVGWVRRVKIRWVRNAKGAQFHEGQIVLRVRPGKNLDHNLIESLYTYFCSALFPTSRDILPDAIVSAIALAIARASLEGAHAYLLKEFDEVFLKAIGESNRNVTDQFGDCVRLNEYGFLMGPFIREVDYVARETRFTSDRVNIPAIIQEILSHMLAFQPLLRANKPEDDWFYIGKHSSYGFILVSKPANIRPGIEAYVKRAQSMVQKGVARIYVIGRYEERDFVFSVIRAFFSIRELKGIESFPLFRDYRGDANGVAALLGRDEILAKLNLTTRPLERMQSDLQTNGGDDDLKPVIDSAQAPDSLAQLEKIAEGIIVQLSDFDGAWIHLAEFGGELRKQFPGFTPQRYGGRNLKAVLKKLDSLEFDQRGAATMEVDYVRLRMREDKAAATATSESNAIQRIVEIISQHARPDGWIYLGALGGWLSNELRDFRFEQFGASSLSQFLRRIDALEFEERGPAKSVYIRIRP